jgi:hypothetical protein
MLEGNKMVRKFLKHVLLNQLPKNKQEACGKDNSFWCADWWTIEVCKCLYLGIEKYNKSRIPKWLQGKTRSRDPSILQAYEYKSKMFSVLTQIKDDADDLLICEVSHGMDILIALQVKKWNNIYCFDQVSGYGPLVEKFFQDNYNIKPIFFYTSTYAFKIDEIPSKGFISISNHSTSLRWEDTFPRFLNNEKTIHLIRDGILEK